MRNAWLPVLLCCSLPLAISCRDRAEAGQDFEYRGDTMRMQDTTQRRDTTQLRDTTQRRDTTDTTRFQRRDTTRTRRPTGGGGAMAANQQVIAQGRAIFTGEAAGGICYTCHGENAKGTPAAPDLTDDQWLNTDGTLAGIQKVIREGVSQPKEHPAPMPPFQSVLNAEQIEAVAAYVRSLSQG